MIESLCKTCEKRYACIMYEPIATVAGCSYFVSQKKAVQTNADRIRTMTDEELAYWLVNVEWRVLERNPALERPMIYDDWVVWLKQEAK